MSVDDLLWPEGMGPEDNQPIPGEAIIRRDRPVPDVLTSCPRECRTSVPLRHVLPCEHAPGYVPPEPAPPRTARQRWALVSAGNYATSGCWFTTSLLSGNDWFVGLGFFFVFTGTVSLFASANA